MQNEDASKPISLSVVVPVFNEAESLPDLYVALDAALLDYV